MSVMPHPKSHAYHDCVHHVLRRRRERERGRRQCRDRRSLRDVACLTSGILTLKFDFLRVGKRRESENKGGEALSEERRCGSWRRSHSSQAAGDAAAPRGLCLRPRVGRPRTCHLGDLDIVGSPRLPTCDRTRRAALMTDLLLAQQMV